MSREEDLIRSTTHAIAATVPDVPPLRLEPGTDERRSPARARRRLGGGPGRARHWWSWGAPLTAAAAVVALAIALVIVRDIPNEGGVAPSPANSTGPYGAPRYYVALTAVAKTTTGTSNEGITVGDSLTGKTLATFAAPAHTIFENVTAAADDRTFVVFALTSSTGSFSASASDTLTASWYEVRLAPGTADPVRLSRLPIESWSWADQGESYNDPAPGLVWAEALSASGQELAVADTPAAAPAGQTQNWQEIKVFSVATGRLLHDWTENDPAVRMATDPAYRMATVNGVAVGTPSGASALTWIDGDGAIAFAMSREAPSGATATVRRVDVAGPATGNLETDSTVIWSGKLTWNDGYGCYSVDEWPPLVSADGKTISCTNYDEVKSAPASWLATFVTDPLPPAPTTAGLPAVDYKVTSPLDSKGKPLAGGADTSLQWVSPSGDAFIVEWHYIENRAPATGVHFGVVSHGKFTPLRVPISVATLAPGEIAW